MRYWSGFAARMLIALTPLVASPLAAQEKQEVLSCPQVKQELERWNRSPDENAPPFKNRYLDGDFSCFEENGGPARLKIAASFNGAIFEGKVSVRGVQFMCGADFSSTDFKHGANFIGTTFMHSSWCDPRAYNARSALFTHAAFDDMVTFQGVTFGQRAAFWRTHFKAPWVAANVIFREGAFFNEATFDDGADFLNVTFEKAAGIWDATFGGCLSLTNTRFPAGLDAVGATFGQSEWTRVVFGGAADFVRAHFTGEARWEHVRFQGTADLLGAKFENSVEWSYVDTNALIVSLPDSGLDTHLREIRPRDRPLCRAPLGQRASPPQQLDEVLRTLQQVFSQKGSLENYNAVTSRLCDAWQKGHPILGLVGGLLYGLPSRWGTSL